MYTESAYPSRPLVTSFSRDTAIYDAQICYSRVRCLFVALAFVFAAAPAQAQFRPRPISEPPTGEKYHIEAAAGLWFPTATIVGVERALWH